MKLLCQIKTVLGEQIPRHPDQGHRSVSSIFQPIAAEEVSLLGAGRRRELNSGTTSTVATPDANGSDLRFFSVASGRKADNLEAALEAPPVRGRAESTQTKQRLNERSLPVMRTSGVKRKFVMKRELPARPDIEQLKRQAKAL